MSTVVALVMAILPDVRPSQTVDASWASVLTYAHTHGLQFGTDVIFTYGPLGFLLTSDSIQYAPWVTAANLAFCFVIALGLCLVISRQTPPWRVLVIGCFVLIAANIPSVSPDFTYLGLFCWGLLCLVEASSESRVVSVSVLALVAAVAALVKVTCLIAAVVCIAAVSSQLAMSRRPKLAALLPSLFCVTFLGGWAACGQDLFHLPAFVSTGLRMALGYSQSMSVEPPALAVIPMVLTGLTAAASVFLYGTTAFRQQQSYRTLRRVILCGWVLLFLFLAWKQSVVRADSQHMVVLFEFAVCSVALGSLSAESTKLFAWARGLGAIACMFAVVATQVVLDPSYAQVDKPMAALLGNTHMLLHPRLHTQEMSRKAAWESYRAELSAVRSAVGHATVDSLGNNQAFAVLNQLNYHPRPVFQSYAAFTSSEMQRNEDFFLSSRAP
ncbi:MAG TPA: hypothetical protein VHI52_17640, partial [Verrucomicrobiae bacterium]|nr:hypothetical protein [Verrucomicrobiae bacterium]